MNGAKCGSTRSARLLSVSGARLFLLCSVFCTKQTTSKKQGPQPKRPSSPDEYTQAPLYITCASLFSKQKRRAEEEMLRLQSAGVLSTKKQLPNRFVMIPLPNTNSLCIGAFCRMPPSPTCCASPGTLRHVQIAEMILLHKMKGFN